MDNTIVTIKIAGSLYPNQKQLEVSAEGLESRLVELLQRRRKLTNVSFRPTLKNGSGRVETVTHVEIVLADEHGSFPYYED